MGCQLAIEELNAIRIPTIALTALASEESQRRGLDSGFDVYLMKPIKPDELLSIDLRDDVERVVRHWNLRSGSRESGHLASPGRLCSGS